MLAAIGGLVVAVDVVVPAVVPSGTASWGVGVMRGLLVVDGLLFAAVLALLVRERGRLDVLGTYIAGERARAEASRQGVAMQSEHMRVVLGVAERLAGTVSLEDISAVVSAAACRITGATAARLLLATDGGGLAPAAAPVRGGRPPAYAGVAGWSLPLLSAGELVGVLELSGVRRPPTPVATVVEALATHAAGALDVVRRYEQLRAVSFADPLTGLPNRGALDIALRTECERAARTGSDVAVVMVDIDHFKVYNDTHGHQEGDAALQAVARLLAKSLRRRGDAAYRYGGEEFVVVLPGTDGESAVAVAERLRDAVAGAAASGVVHHPVTASFGVAGRCAGRRGAAELLGAADAALYRAKQLGRDRVELAGEDFPLLDGDPAGP